MKSPFSAAFLFSNFGMIKDVSLVLCLPFCVTTSYAASFIPLGHLPNEVNGSSIAYGVSSDGAVVVGSGVEAFIGNIPDPIIGIGVPSGAVATTAQATSTNGAYIAGFAHYSGSDIEAFRWSQNGGYKMLGFLPNNSSNPASFARDVSSDGSTVVGSSDSNLSPFGFRQAFRWTETTGMVGLGDLAGGNISSAAEGVSADGSVVVGRSHSGSNDEAFIWTEATGMTGLGDFNGSNGWSTAYDVNSSGSHVVGFARSGSGFDAFLWTESSGLLSLGELAGGQHNSKAFGVSADGSVIVGDSSTGVSTPGGNEAFIWNSLAV